MDDKTSKDRGAGALVSHVFRAGPSLKLNFAFIMAFRPFTGLIMLLRAELVSHRTVLYIMYIIQ